MKSLHPEQSRKIDPKLILPLFLLRIEIFTLMPFGKGEMRA